MKAAFEKLGDRVSEVPRGDLALEVAARWLEGSPGQRERTGVIAPTRALRAAINELVQGYRIWEGHVDGPEWKAEKLVSHRYINVEKAVYSNYTVGDTVSFNRPYKTFGVEKSDERIVSRVDHDSRTVHFSDDKGRISASPPLTACRLWNGKASRTAASHSNAVTTKSGTRHRN